MWGNKIMVFLLLTIVTINSFVLSDDDVGTDVDNNINSLTSLATEIITRTDAKIKEISTENNNNTFQVDDINKLLKQLISLSDDVPVKLKKMFNRVDQCLKQGTLKKLVDEISGMKKYKTSMLELKKTIETLIYNYDDFEKLSDDGIKSTDDMSDFIEKNTNDGSENIKNEKKNLFNELIVVDKNEDSDHAGSSLLDVITSVSKEEKKDLCNDIMSPRELIITFHLSTVSTEILAHATIVYSTVISGLINSKDVQDELSNILNDTVEQLKIYNKEFNNKLDEIPEETYGCDG